MMNIHDFLDQKHGPCIGRVYMLVALFIFNALIPIGAVMTYLYSMTAALLIIGVIGTVVCWAILSTPTKIK